MVTASAPARQLPFNTMSPAVPAMRVVVFCRRTWTLEMDGEQDGLYSRTKFSKTL